MYLGAPKAAREYGKRCPRTRGAVRPRPLPKLCQELRRRPPTLANATDATRSHLRSAAAALPRVWRPHEDRLLHHRSARRHRHPAPPRAPAHTSTDLTRSWSAAGGLPPRPDSGLRALRGRTSPRVRIRPVAARRVRPLKGLVPLPSPTASAFRPPRSAHLNIPTSQSIIRLSTTTQSASSIRTTSPPLPPLPIP